jgi:hypothetical protein
MGRVTFSNENKKVTTNYDYPKLKLKSGERARILLLEDPVMEYVHTLQKPTIVNGKPLTIEAERRNGEKYTDYKKDFVSRPICLGDESILASNGSDPKNCPMCALAKSDPDATKAPMRRFAMHIVRYKTKPGTVEVQTPYGVDVVVWSFTDKVFGQIVDFKEEWDDLRKHDMTLGPCTNEMFQQFDINVGAKAEWLMDKDRQALTAEAFKNNQIEDLSIACGSRKEKRWIEEDIASIIEAWAVVNGSPAQEESDAAISANLDTDLSSLLEDTPAAKTSAPASDPLADLDSFPATAETGPDEKAIQPITGEATTAATADLDDLLADL